MTGVLLRGLLVGLVLMVPPVQGGATRAPGRDCRFDSEPDRTVAQEMLRLILSGALADGVEKNPCLVPGRFRRLRVPSHSQEGATQKNAFVGISAGDSAEILEQKRIDRDQVEVAFVVRRPGKETRDSFTMLLHLSPKIQEKLGCADLLEAPRYRYKPADVSHCPQ